MRLGGGGGGQPGNVNPGIHYDPCPGDIHQKTMSTKSKPGYS